MLGLAILFAVAVLLIALVGGLLIGRGLEHPPRRTFGNALAYGLPTSPGELGVEFLELDFKLSDGHTSPGWIARCDEDPDKPLVIVSHGWGDSRYGALTRLPLLRDFASHVVLYDARGHGDSTAKRFDLATTEVLDLLAIVRQSLEAIGQPNRRVVLFGYSMGGGISIVAAAREPDAIAGVIAEGVYRDMMEPVRGYVSCRGAPAWLFMPVLHVFARGKMPSAVAFDRAGHAARMTQPLLVVHGTEDQICEYASGKAIAEAAPHGRLVTFEGSDHLSLATNDEERYREALAGFFADLRAGTRMETTTND